MSARRVPSSRRRSAAARRGDRRRPRHLRRPARRGLRHARIELVGILAASVAVLLVVTGAVVAYFGATGADTAAGTVGSLAAPTDVTAAQVAGTSDVQVDWTASAGTPVPDGYYVTRTTGSGTANACGSSPTALITSASGCTDSSVATGTHTYRVVAVHRSWTATSAPVDATVVVLVAPVITNIVPGGGGFGASWPTISCTTSNNRRICADVTTAAGTITSVSYRLQRSSDGRCYDGAGALESDWTVAACSLQHSMTLSTAPRYQSGQLFAAAYAEDDTYTVTVTASNSVGGQTSAQATRSISATSPTVTLTRWTNDGSAVTLSATDPNGVASISYRIDAASGPFTTVGGAGPVTLPTLSTGDHTVDYVVTDGVGHATTVTDAPVTVEITPPVISNLVPATGTGASNFSGVDCNVGSTPNSQRLCATVTDTGGSGVATVTYQLKRASDDQCYDGLGGNPTTDWSLAACSSDPAMSLDAGTLYRTPVILSGAYADGDEYTFTVTATDNAGNPASASSVFFLDGTAPTATSWSPTDGSSWNVDAASDANPNWSTVCGSGRICINGVDDPETGIKSVTFTLVRDQPGMGQDRCWNAVTLTFVNGLACTPAAMTHQSGGTWAGLDIPAALIEPIKSGNWDLVITVTNQANVSFTTGTIDLTFD